MTALAVLGPHAPPWYALVAPRADHGNDPQ
jgi:hypothetical protein